MRRDRKGPRFDRSGKPRPKPDGQREAPHPGPGRPGAPSDRPAHRPHKVRFGAVASAVGRPERDGAGEGRSQKQKYEPGRGVRSAQGKDRPERSRPDKARPERVRADKTRVHAGKPKVVEGGSPAEPMRIAKAMARAGLCSRREAERWIAEGRVSLNGKVLATPAVEVGPKDRVLVDGQPLPDQDPIRLWRYYKPRGLVTTHNDPEGRPTVFDNLPPELPRVISIGRLDFNTEGLLLLTNDGQLARHLELPATGWLRRYRVRVRGRITQAQLNELKDGISLEGINYGPVEATLDSEQGQNMWITVGLREGKNREIRKIMGHFGLEVSRLIRISFGPFQLFELEPGGVEVVRRRVLREQLGPRIARDLGITAGTEPQDERTGKVATGRADADDDARPADRPVKRRGAWKP